MLDYSTVPSGPVKGPLGTAQTELDFSRGSRHEAQAVEGSRQRQRVLFQGLGWVRGRLCEADSWRASPNLKAVLGQSSMLLDPDPILYLEGFSNH